MLSAREQVLSAVFDHLQLNIVVVIVVVLWLLRASGVLGSLESTHIAR